MAAVPPPKPWERNRGVAPATSTPAPLPAATLDGTTPAFNQTESVVSQSAAANAGNAAALTRPVPARPWDRGGVASTSYSGYPSSTSYSGNQQFGAATYGGNRPGMYGGSYANQYQGSLGSTYGSSYGSGAYGSTYGGGMGGYSSYARPGMYGGTGMYGAPSMYGSSPYGSVSGYGGAMYGMPGPGSMMAGPGFDPNNPPAQPPTAWQHFLMAMNGALQFFSKICFLVDENTHAFHFFINALLQLLDRAGSLYGELARFVLRLLRLRRGRQLKELEPGHPAAAHASTALVPHIGPPLKPMTGPDGGLAGPGSGWDGLWRS